MHPVLKPLPLLGRILVALIFVLAGINKLGSIDATAANMASHGIPYARDLVWGVIALELIGDWIVRHTAIGTTARSSP